jgi:hypothetical protein
MYALAIIKVQDCTRQYCCFAGISYPLVKMWIRVSWDIPQDIENSQKIIVAAVKRRKI